MKRLIKFHSDNGKFHNTNTERKLFPILVGDNAGMAELYAYAMKLDVQNLGEYTAETPQYGWNPLDITHAIKISDNGYKTEYLGFITLPKADQLPLLETLDNEVSLDQAREIVNNQWYGIDDVGPTVSNDTVLVQSGWNYYHEIPLLGYSLESFEEVSGITEHGFYDDTYACHECGVFDSRDDGYTNNFRVVGDSLLGINCGCYFDACKNDWESFIDDINNPMELSAAEALAEEGKLIHIERYIGGMVDGRGGYYAGKSAKEGNPKEILKALKKENPESSYIFSHDESGQFQTYFSVWQVVE